MYDPILPVDAPRPRPPRPRPRTLGPPRPRARPSLPASADVDAVTVPLLSACTLPRGLPRARLPLGRPLLLPRPSCSYADVFAAAVPRPVPSGPLDPLGRPRRRPVTREEIGSD